MTHFTAIVAAESEGAAEALLHPYDETKPVAPYVHEGMDWKVALDKAKTYFHEASLSPNGTRETRKNAAKMLERTDLELLHDYSGHQWKPKPNGEEGFDYWTTYNPDSKFDWISLGGRWDKELITKTGRRVNVCRVEEFDLDHADQHIPTAYLGPDGKWFEKGRVGWFGSVSNALDEDVWDKQFKDWIRTLPEDLTLYLYDLHI